jgi:sugar lactone lactonase YvrE
MLLQLKLLQTNGLHIDSDEQDILCIETLEARQINMAAAANTPVDNDSRVW